MRQLGVLVSVLALGLAGLGATSAGPRTAKSAPQIFMRFERCGGDVCDTASLTLRPDVAQVETSSSDASGTTSDVQCTSDVGKARFESRGQRGSYQEVLGPDSCTAFVGSMPPPISVDLTWQELPDGETCTMSGSLGTFGPADLVYCAVIER